MESDTIAPVAEEETLVPARYEATTYLGVPAALAVNETPPGIHDQRFLITLTGVLLGGLKGNSSQEWLKKTVPVYPDDQADAWRSVIYRYQLPLPPGRETSDYYLGFQVDRFSVFAALNSVYHANRAVNAGFAVDRWRVRPYANAVDAFTGQQRSVYQGVELDLAVCNPDAILYRVGYQITLLGRVVFFRPS